MQQLLTRTLPFDETDIDSIYQYAEKNILGKRAKDLTPLVIWNNSQERYNKGGLGEITERALGIIKNSESLPDFPLAPLELKAWTVRILKLGNKKKGSKKGWVKAKERVKICHIDLIDTDVSSFASSQVYHKIKNVLHVIYEYEKNKPMKEFKCVGVCIISIEEGLDEFNLLDIGYERIHNRIIKGEAHLLGQDSRYMLDSCRCGSGKNEKKIPQPNSDIDMYKRAFIFPPNYLDDFVIPYVVWEKSFYEENIVNNSGRMNFYRP